MTRDRCIWSHWSSRIHIPQRDFYGEDAGVGVDDAENQSCAVGTREPMTGLSLALYWQQSTRPKESIGQGRATSGKRFCIQFISTAYDGYLHVRKSGADNVGSSLGHYRDSILQQ